MVDITISHPDVNSGDDVELNGTKLTYAWENFVQGKPIIGLNDITEKGQNGFENAVINISGVWDIDEQIDLNTPFTYDADPLPLPGNIDLRTKICQKLLVDFATLQSTTPITLTVLTGENQTPLGGRPTAGYSSGANTLLGTISVAIKSFKLSLGTATREGQMWDYSLTLTETT